VGALILGAAIGASDDSTKTATPDTVTQAVTETITRTETVTRTVQAAQKRPPPPPPASRPQRFSGNGGKTMPPITLSKDSTLIWTADGGIFQIFEDELGVPVNSQASRGDTFVPAGTYTFQINAVGNWTIQFR
jgi:hypothetical protein